ncbi:MAG: ribulose-phosphate 3-epimerase [Candidatus Micrarchaeaceae archaeon]
MGKILISPSILSSDFGNLREVIKELDSCKVDRIHIDVMDGIFVPNITIGPVVIASIRNATKIPFETHLMIEHPDKYIKSFADAGSDTIIVHYESKHDLRKTIDMIKSLNKKVGISIKPKTPFNAIKEYLPYTDLLLIMSVEPGFGGQSFMEDSIAKIKEAREYIDKNSYKTIIAVDGGLDIQNSKRVADAGANEIIAGSAIFNSGNISQKINDFKNL